MNEPTPEQCELLLDQAREAQKLSYSPYSHFAVGASALASDYTITTAANIENASYSLSMCAERLAMFAMRLKTTSPIITIAITAGKGNRARPCGACLQVMQELAPDTWLVLDDGNGGYDLMQLPDLLPQPFTLEGC